MARITKNLANKDYGTYRLGAAFTRNNGAEEPTANEAITNNRYVTYMTYCKACNNVSKKMKADLYAGFVCSCGAVHAGPTKATSDKRTKVTVFMAGDALVMIPLAKDDAEVLFRLNLDYQPYYEAWRQGGSVIWVSGSNTTASALHLLHKQDGTTITGETAPPSPPPLPMIGKMPAYIHEKVDAATLAAYEAEMHQPITLPSGKPPTDLGEVFTSTVTTADLVKYEGYYDSLPKLAEHLQLRPVAPNQRSGWLVSSTTRSQILAGLAKPAFADASTNFESIATYLVNDVAEVWYYLYEYAPSSSDDSYPDF